MKWLATILLVGLFAILSPHCEAVTAGLREFTSCQEIARLIISSEANRDTKVPALSAESLNCAGAHGIAADATVQLTKTWWNKALQRWEFTLHCTHAHDCVPFLVWAGKADRSAPRMDTPPTATAPKLSPAPEKQLHKGEDAKAAGVVSVTLVKPGQKVTLTWDQRGIRVVLPVTCLDAGGMGQFVRVRLPNAPRILRAEVVGRAMLRANL
jgi:hypothetical protein